MDELLKWKDEVIAILNETYADEEEGEDGSQDESSQNSMILHEWLNDET